MALFDVPGWTIPADVQPASSANSRKRKRPGSASGDGSSGKVQSAEVNMEKLMKKLGKEVVGDAGTTRIDGETERGKAAHRRNRKKISPEVGEADGCINSREFPDALSSKKPLGKQKRSSNNDTDGPLLSPQSSRRASRSSDPKQAHPKNEGMVREKEKKNKGRKAVMQEQKEHTQAGGSDAHLTSLQTKMKQSLDGARFRWINETLYKSTSRDAERLMHEDPKVFEEYHAGFRHQVTSWPSNPVKHFIEVLSSYPERTVIVDLGCGDAALAQDLISKSFVVLSYDLVAANAFIVATDICDRLPIPGAGDKAGGQIVDVVVCSLSLMSTNWLNCIREARRVLKTGGELKIAEVASRFTNVDKFTSVINSVGFRLVSKDERNSHFTLFDFKKTEGSRKLDEEAWQKIMVRGDVLQPCEYKRR
ncbi:hypothetical protein M0805_007291 [Coniferiporia weirii]|nr:hypothetical protein M0805_007291 [Coniferiporia weirii]